MAANGRGGGPGDQARQVRELRSARVSRPRRRARPEVYSAPAAHHVTSLQTISPSRVDKSTSTVARDRCVSSSSHRTMMREINLQLAWLAILLGLLTGAGVGLFFHQENWLGGYGSWRRRMIRLGHISFFGTGFLNLAFALSVRHIGLEPVPAVASAGFVLGALAMPTVCFLSAWRASFRHLFFVPVAALIVATADFLFRGALAMKIGLIAMSGVRACDPELVRLGMTLPGFVERGRTIASLPSLGLLTLAGMTPPPHECEYLEVKDLRELDTLPDRFDLVAISSLSAQIGEAYELADRYRARGVPVIMGGLHVTAMPDEAGSDMPARSWSAKENLCGRPWCAMPKQTT